MTNIKSCKRGARTCGIFNCYKEATKQIIYPSGRVKAQYCSEHFEFMKGRMVTKKTTIKVIKKDDPLDKIFVTKHPIKSQMEEIK